jgi:hypothetical protein
LLGFSLTLKMEEVYSSEIVGSLHTAWCYNLEDWMDPSEVNCAFQVMWWVNTGHLYL